MAYEEFELVIVGGGVVGLSTALAAAKSGVKSIICIDQHGVANSFGASGDGLRLFRLSYFEHPSYVPLLRQAIESWRQLGDSLYCPVGGFYAGPLKCELIQGSLESANLHNIDHDIMPVETARKQFPQFALPPDYVVFVEQEGGYVRAAQGTVAVGIAAQSLGVMIAEAQVMGLHPNGNKWVVEGSDFSVLADRVVVATGYETSDLVPKLKPFLTKEAHLLLWLEDLSHRYDEGPGFGIMNDMGEMLYGFPAVDDVPGVKVGGHHRFSSSSIERQEARLCELATQYLPSVSTNVLSKKTCPYDMSPDGNFMFGEIEPGLSVACGFSGHGFKFGPVLGNLAWQAANRNLPEELEFLDVSRYIQ
jgi:sarcosine oxidase